MDVYIYVSRIIFTLRFSVHVGHMEMRPRLRAPYDILEEREIELMTPMCKASGLHIHYNTAIVYDPGILARGVQARLPENSSDNVVFF